MSKTKHTPGPWKTGLMDELKSGSRCAWVSGPMGCIAHVYPDREHDGVDNVEHTAALIAAAPELLATVKLLLDNGSFGDCSDPSCDCEGNDHGKAIVSAALEAIAKAGGRHE